MLDEASGAGTTTSPEVLQERLTAVEHLARVGFWEWRIQEDVTDWTPSLFRVFGYEPGAIGPSYEAWLNLIHPDDREFVNELVQKAFAARSSYAFDHRIIWPDGTVRVLHCRGQVFSDDNDEPTRIAGISEDVTDKRTSEETLRSFIADAAHELRTPVSAIQTAAALLDRTDDGAQRQAALEILQRQVERLGTLTTQLLDLEALRPGGKLGLVLGPISVGAAVELAVDAVMLPDGATVEVDVEPDDLQVRGVGDHLERIIVNLLENAARHGGPNIQISAHPVGDRHVEIVVRDDGPGVPADLRETMFMPFSRTREAGREGIGLGLAIARRLTEGLGGDLAYQSPSDGGALFRLTLERLQ